MVANSTAYQAPAPRHSRGWPPERRAAQAARCRAAKPWRKSTGPKSDAGKKIVSLNAYKHGLRSAAWTLEVRRFHAILRLQRAYLRRVKMHIYLTESGRLLSTLVGKNGFMRHGYRKTDNRSLRHGWHHGASRQPEILGRVGDGGQYHQQNRRAHHAQERNQRLFPCARRAARIVGASHTPQISPPICRQNRAALSGDLPVTQPVQREQYSYRDCQ